MATCTCLHSQIPRFLERVLQLGTQVLQFGNDVPRLGLVQAHSWRWAGLLLVRPTNSVPQLGPDQRCDWADLSTAGWAQVLEDLGVLLFMKLGSIVLSVCSSDPLGFGLCRIGPAQGLDLTHFTFSPFSGDGRRLWKWRWLVIV